MPYRKSQRPEVEVTAGFLKHRVKANWKFILENECDGYHPAFVHSSIFGVADRVYAMAEGRLIASGDPVEIRRHPAVLEAYLDPAGTS